jgi:nitroimidazol reductase NimA-like FMN-containing flavoprotein (pyridoxamine 5'-phosphate oxidase superfamily)
MRRKDREMSKEFGLAVIDEASFGVLSMINQDHEPYAVPLSLAREGNYLYFHSAKEGEKITAFVTNPHVSVTFVTDVRVPELFTEEELDEILADEGKASLLGSRVFTTEYASACVRGTLCEVRDVEEKIKAMRCICQKYTPTKMKYFDRAIADGLGKANVYRIEISEVTAKRKKYDDQGEEMKWGRV